MPAGRQRYLASRIRFAPGLLRYRIERNLMPAETGLAFVTSEQALRDANRRFYAAFEAMDLAALEEVWAHEEWVQCVHPGWDLLLGWDEVRESYMRIFSNTR